MNDIVISNLSFAYEDKIVFDNFNAKFFSNKINVILGESGIGKTTLLRCISGLEKYSGTIENVPDNVSIIFQKDRLIPTITVFSNLDLVLKSVFKNKEERKKKIFEMLRILEIEELAKRYPTEISGGQAQRVSIARAFLYPSSLLLMDEAFKEMDGELKERQIKAFLDLWNKDKRTVIMVTHNRKEAAIMADTIQILKGNPVTVSEEIAIDGEKGICSRMDKEFFITDLD